MPYLTDIIIFITIILSTCAAYQKGFFRTFLALISNLLSVILSFVLQPIVYSLIKDTPLTNTIKKAMSNAIPEIESSLKPVEFINSLEFSDFIKKMIIEGLNEGLINNTNTQTFITKYITDFFIHIFSFVITFFVVSLIFVIIRKVIYAIRTLPVLKQFDNLVGAVLGFIRGILLSFIIVILAVLLQTYDTTGFVTTSINNSIIIDNVTKSDFFKEMTDNIDMSENSEIKKTTTNGER